MNMRETSHEAYAAVLSSEYVSKKQREVYTILFNDGPLTSAQIALRMAQKGYIYGPNGPCVHPRLSELREMHVVKELTEVTCPITKLAVIYWDVTRDLPIKRLKTAHISRFEQAKRMLFKLIEACDEERVLQSHHTLAEARRFLENV